MYAVVGIFGACDFGACDLRSCDITWGLEFDILCDAHSGREIDMRTYTLILGNRLCFFFCFILSINPFVVCLFNHTLLSGHIEYSLV